MCAHVLLKLLNELGESENLRGMSSIYIAFLQRVYRDVEFQRMLNSIRKN